MPLILNGQPDVFYIFAPPKQKKKMTLHGHNAVLEFFAKSLEPQKIFA